MKKLKILIYGTGCYAEYFYNLTKDSVDILGFVEHASRLREKTFLNIPVQSLEDSTTQDYDFMVICSQSSESIVDTIVNTAVTPIKRKKLIDPNMKIELFSFFQLVNANEATISTTEQNIQQLYIYQNLYRLYTQINRFDLVEHVFTQIQRISSLVPNGEQYLPNDTNLSTLSENERVDKIIARRNLEDLKKQYIASRINSMGDPEKRVESIFMASIPLAAGVFITESLLKRLNRNHIGCNTAHYPGGTINLDQLYNFAKGGYVTSGHIDPSKHNIRCFQTAGVKRLIVHLRDPRSALVSMTHHVGVNSNSPNVWRYMPFMNYPMEFFTWPFSKMIDHMIEHHLAISLDWMRGWIEAADSGKLDILITHFEDFKKKPNDFFSSILNHYDIDSLLFSDEKLSEKRGQYFLRRGALEEWRERCSPEQIKRMTDAIPEEYFDRFGWSKDI